MISLVSWLLPLFNRSIEEYLCYFCFLMFFSLLSMLFSFFCLKVMMFAKEDGDCERESALLVESEADSSTSCYCEVCCLPLSSFLFFVLNCLMSFHSP